MPYDHKLVEPLLKLIYPTQDPCVDFRMQRRNRCEILAAGYEQRAPGTWLSAHNDHNLPRTDRSIQFNWGLNPEVCDIDLVSFMVTRYVKGSKKHRFHVECPSCGTWTTVGKYMLHAKIHKEK